ncbi:MAG: ABC transporter ATP-binding protein [Clostridium chrysemydis]|uniref:ABC transporter ATP-binding protein n=1 Tax=Clostridium TaxID=1485 RepID=UPI00215276A3|nr:ABC transporter ATP-binding protein [Clostridium sp. LY3-2]MCR6514155.1 ABC transporter ATP-binding protein [Clostridium sp. LY3-2]
MKAIIKVRELNKTYSREKYSLQIEKFKKDKEEGKTVALKGINMDVLEGEFLVIMGPSGAGKSTLLNMISTIDKDTKGAVKILDEDISRLNEIDISKFRYEKLGFIFQKFNVLNNLTVKENIILPLALKNDSIENILEKLNSISERLEIKNLLEKYPNECSGGQIQKIAVARALINNPKIIVADEPTGNLDSRNSHNLLEFLKMLNETEKKTVIMVTHDPMIASYGRRVLYLKDGIIEKEILRKDLNQKDYFYNILDTVSKESLDLFNK